ncbi:hypothetical protein EFP34_03760 [Lacticaseibacillus paracasei]|jgi:hypothetical protein|uniref:hypothetical protein n=1 Tax=Lacticaseibacillus paracasei TaxID=1597 RepID=UPI0003B6F210|nr:hypothetical protein [Lacticaseibacillus paracasei]ERN48489.1 hypothetical protein N422_12450 [Lacticaseibacillus paracasei]MCT3320217.1 hypothetical protein [Lacticaseibacillus paracasei]MCT3349679.1 hypothetical protein [Lacticaseibacillus paracasei]GAN41797.1 hypothetical protein LC1981_1016 [Lacticaseibacillus paracasei NRIC 1981]
MALKTNKSISLTGTSTIGDVQVAYLNATIDQEGNGANAVNQSIQNQALYDANKKEVRADIAEFQQLLYDTEDSLTSEKEGTDSSKTSGN